MTLDLVNDKENHQKYLHAYTKDLIIEGDEYENNNNLFSLERK